MHINDIQPLTYINGGFEIDLYDVQDWLKSYNERYGINIDPYFQRPLVWTEERKSKFMEFLLRGGRSLPLLWNSPVYGGHDSKNSNLGDEIILVDGKQRLNCIVQFLENKLPVFNGNLRQDIDGIERHLRRTSIVFQINRLQTTKQVLTWYMEINEGHVAHTEEELDRVRKLIV